MLLLGDGARCTVGASSKTAFDQQLMQLRQGGHRKPWIAKLHARAHSNIEHPGGHDNDHAGRYLDVNHLTVGSLFAVLPPQTAAIERVPAVVDLDFLPDMRRMTCRLLSEGRTGCSRAACARASAPPRS
jgi:hypothetical protein